MTIRVYPSRLEGEPIETHETTGRMSITDWLKSVAPSFRADAENVHPTIRVNQELIPPESWPLTFFLPSDDIDIYIEARGVETIIYAVLFVIAVAVAMSVKAPSAASNRRAGRTLEEPGELANQVRWGDPIPDIAGSPITYPDYILPPRRYFQNKTQQWVDSLVCVGVGSYQIDTTQIWVGETPVTTLGDDVEVTVYEPNQTIPADHSSWWHTPEEVGFTTLGGSGMTMGPSEQITAFWTSDVTLSGQNITGDVAVPSDWENGLTLRVECDHPIKYSGNAIESAMLDTLGLTPGDMIEITGVNSGIYTVSTIESGSGGDPGSPATATGSISPIRYDFSVTPAFLTISLGTSSPVVSLTTTVSGLSELVNVMNSQLNSTRVRARESSGALEIYQIDPYDGGNITISGDVSDLLGSPTFVAGTPTVLPSGSRYIVAGANFGTSTETASAGFVGLGFQITNISVSTVTVAPPDVPFWTGFPSNTSNASSGVQVDRGSMVGGWLGWFTATPRGEESDCFEVDISLPNGLISYNKKGRIRSASAGGEIQWRYIGSPTINSFTFNNSDSNADYMGHTYRINHAPGRVEVRVRASSAPSTSASVSDKQQWSGLRSRIIGAPSRYPNMTLLHVSLRSGDKISGGVENRLSIRPMRILPVPDNPAVQEPTRGIIPYFIYMMETVGYGRDKLDIDHLIDLHDIYEDRQDYFDLSVNSSSTLKTIANYCLSAGFAELNLRKGKISAARDALRLEYPSRIYSAQELRKGGELVEITKSRMPDEIDGVDVEYIDYQTGRSMTEPYRLAGDQGLRVQK